MSFVVLVSKRYCRFSRRFNFKSFVTIASILSISIGVLALIIVVSIMSGFEQDFKLRIMRLTPDITVTKHNNGKIYELDPIFNQLTTIPGIDKISSYTSDQIIASKGNTITGAILNGVTNFEFYDQNTQQHRLSQEKIPPIILDNQLADNLDVVIGDIIKIATLPKTTFFYDFTSNIENFYITAIIESKSTLPSAYVPIKIAQKLLKFENLISRIEIKVKNVEKANKIAKSILLKKGDTFSVKSWDQMNIAVFSALKLEKIIMFITLSLIIAIASFGIMASLMMTVFEKKREISILKTLGANNKEIKKIFVINGMGIGALGTLIGTILGIVASTVLNKYPVFELPTKIYYTSTLPVCLNIIDIFIIVSISLLISFLASVYPAKIACNNDLNQTLNHK